VIKSEYRSTLESLYNPAAVTTNNDADKLLSTLDKAEDLLFDGKDEVQPVKWHQVKRIYQLAGMAIKIVKIIWPYLRIIISLIKK
jgi:hypothetical protein